MAHQTQLDPQWNHSGGTRRKCRLRAIVSPIVSITYIDRVRIHFCGGISSSCAELSSLDSSNCSVRAASVSTWIRFRLRPRSSALGPMFKLRRIVAKTTMNAQTPKMEITVRWSLRVRSSDAAGRYVGIAPSERWMLESAACWASMSAGRLRSSPRHHVERTHGHGALADGSPRLKYQLLAQLDRRPMTTPDAGRNQQLGHCGAKTVRVNSAAWSRRLPGAVTGLS